MNLLLLFINGEKGLVAQDNGKFYFPDRKSTIKNPGLYDCTISIDKEKYAFVVGEKVKTLPPSEETYLLLAKKILADNDYDYISSGSVAIVTVGNDIMIRRKTPFRTYLENMSEDGSFKNGISYVTDYRRSSIYQNLPEKYVDDQYLLKAFGEIDKIPDEEKLRVISTAVNSHAGKIGIASKFTVKILEDRYVDVEYDSYGYMRHNISIYVHGMLKSVSDMFYKSILMKDVTYSIEWKDLSKMLYDKHFGFSPYKDSKDGIISKKINCFGQMIILKMFDVSDKNNWNNEHDKEKQRFVQESFDSLESFKRAVAKNVTSKTLDELKLLSPQNVIIGDY